MESKLKEMFPSGEWGTGQKAWMVKDGTYFCAAADIIDGEVVLTELGIRLSGAAPSVEKVTGQSEGITIPEFIAPKAPPKVAPKKTGLRK